MLTWLNRRLRIRKLRKGIDRAQRWCELVDAFEREVAPLPAARVAAEQIQWRIMVARAELARLENWQVGVTPPLFRRRDE